MTSNKTNKCKCCRTPLTKNHQLIFSDEGKGRNIAQLLFEHFGKRLNENDGQDQAVCGNCSKQLVQFWEFKQKCMQSTESSSDNDDEVETGEMVADESEEYVEVEYEENVPIEEFVVCDKNHAIFSEEMNEEEVDNVEAVHEVIEYVIPFEEVLEEYIIEDESDDEPDDKCTEVYLDHNDEHLQILQVFTVDEPKKFQMNLSPLRPTHKRSLSELENIVEFKARLKEDVPCHKLQNQTIDEKTFLVSEEEESQDMKNESMEEKIDDYIKSVVWIIYLRRFQSDFSCPICETKLNDHIEMMNHIMSMHQKGNCCQCIFSETCPLFTSANDLQSHILNDHLFSVPTIFNFICTTCDTSIMNAKDFMKHICVPSTQLADTQLTSFNCKNCHKNFTSRKRFIFHSQFHLERSRPKICIICELLFEKEESFYNHVMFAHENILEYFCELCDRSFSSKLLLSRHEKVHNVDRDLDENRYVATTTSTATTIASTSKSTASVASQAQLHGQSLMCEICGQSFKRPTRLRKHMTKHETIESKEMFVCAICTMVFVDESLGAEHHEQHHDDNENSIETKQIDRVMCCEFCANAFTSIDSLMAHRTRHADDEVPFQCEYCPNKYETFSKLKTHYKTHWGIMKPYPIVRFFVCERTDCHKMYRHWSDLQNHLKTTHLINPYIYKCDFCPKTFYNSWNYFYHKNTVHGQKTKCTQCDKEYESLIRMQSHMRYAHSEKPKMAKKATEKKVMKKRNTNAINIDEYLAINDDRISCVNCNKLMTSMANARAHVESVHLKIKKHICNHCDRGFYARKDLTDHVRVHTEETPFECDQCDKKFRTIGLLQQHRKSHSDERLFKCEHCSWSFKRANNLKLHVKQHFGIRDFKCSFSSCKKQFRSQWEANAHFKKTHAVMKETKTSTNARDQSDER